MIQLTRADLGWSAVFQSQLSLEELETYEPLRISSVHRSRLESLSCEGEVSLSLPTNMSSGEFAVGDWVLADAEHRVHRLLERKSELGRRGAGERASHQLIAANVDTLAIVTSCNADFNLARIERYLVMAANAGCLPLVVLTKADLCDDPSDYRRQAEALSPLLSAITVNGHDPDDIKALSDWIPKGNTMAMAGSSGVGKTTLMNSLTGREDATQGIREDDAKGRHTTTWRALVRTLSGGWIIDTPGMRELGMSSVEAGLEVVFDDIETLATQCKFNDCAHDSEPGCAIRKAVADGELDADRLRRWHKLSRENLRNSETLAQSHARARAQEKIYAGGKAQAKRKRGG